MSEKCGFLCLLLFTNIFLAIRALIDAIAPDISRNSGGNLTSEEVARRLNDKLAELVEPLPIEIRNERGEVCSTGIGTSND